MKEKITTSSGNVFADLGFEPGEALSIQIRSDLMTCVHRLIASHPNQASAAAALGVSQPRISDLVRGQIEKFSIDGLVEMIGRAGLTAAIDIAVDDRTPAITQEFEGSCKAFLPTTAWATHETLVAPAKSSGARLTELMPAA